MNILMMTNTFTPHVGGVARSVEGFTAAYRARGHRVLVVAPIFEHMPEREEDVVRVPAIQNFNGSDFSVVLPSFNFLNSAIEEFVPDLVHSHHPFLVGTTALRVSQLYELPLVFTHHTMYEEYTHYVPGDSKALKRFVVDLSTSYANLCDHVFAPSESVAAVLQERGVTAPVAVVPTGIDLTPYQSGNGPGFRAAVNIPEDAFVVGHVGRLAPEKNLGFLTEAVAEFMVGESRAHFLVVGGGASEEEIRRIMAARGVAERLHMVGVLQHPLLASAYKAMDIFAFASASETQGIVLTEAMAGGAPVVALDAPGAREAVRDGVNGRLLTDDTTEAFAAALRKVASGAPDAFDALRAAARETAEEFSMARCADRALALYAELYTGQFQPRPDAYKMWQKAARMIRTEWEVLKGVAGAAGAAVIERDDAEED